VFRGSANDWPFVATKSGEDRLSEHFFCPIPAAGDISIRLFGRVQIPLETSQWWLSGKSCTLSHPPTQEVIHMSYANAPSSLQGNKAVVIRWFDEVWNQGRRETIRELFAAQGVLHDGAITYQGPEEFTRFYDKLRAEFSKFSLRPIVSLAEGDLACVHWTVECVHTASGTPVRLTGTSVVRISNGQFVEAWQNWDAAGLAAQLPSESPQTGNPI
jgi:predicted SnoaL-like aldol condensation-catalyzing enzyme